MNFQNVWTYVFLTIFVVFTTLHLIASAKNNKKFRNLTKGFILSSLLGFYLAAAPVVDIWIVLALIFSWIGDMLLIPHGTKWFTAGGISFMLSHACFVVGYVNQIESWENIPIIVIVFLALFFVGLVGVIFKKLKKSLPKPLFYPMALYLFINGTMNCFAIYKCLCDESFSSIITVIGAVLFFISDASLFFVRFDKNTKMKSHFRVMLTYSLGEFLIVLGLMLNGII